jgi:superfamily II DNA/RNA helicase
MSFSTLGLDPSLLENLTRLGYAEPTQVQREAIPAALAGGDLLVSSQTGSGKTAAFVLPALQRLRTPAARHGKGPRLLVLVPTRELAMQVQKAVHGYCRGQNILTTCLVGGVPFGKQLDQVRKNVDVAICTPGRLKDHLDRGSMDLNRVEILVLDEADRMLDMGFQDEIDAILLKAPKERQTLLFSATLHGVVGKLASRVTRNPVRIEVASKMETKPDITQHALIADNREHKGLMLDSLLRETDVDQALVFTATKREAAELTNSLVMKGFTAGALHGDMHQKERTRTLNRVRDRSVRVLVATDVAARGIDVPGINLVVNYDAPRQAEDYVHRIGRTGRAGRAGIAVTFLGQQDRNLVKNIERFTGNKVTMMEITGLEPRTKFQDTSRAHKPQNNARKTWGGRPARPTTRHSPRPAGR